MTRRDASDLRVGEQVAGYRIRRVLGRGGSGTVYEAARDHTSAVALKVMHEQDPSGVGRKRFVREAALVQKLDHPNVVKLLDYGHTESGVPFIAFELLAGRSLKATLRRSGAFDVVRTGRVALQTLEALVAAHAMGIIHRDIKPANIFIREDTAVEKAQVLDFGLAKALEGEGAEVATITDTGYRLGTPRYMSPEMARGLKVGEAGDLYALGLIMAELLAGRPVVRDEAQIDIMMAHASDHPLELDPVVRDSPLFPSISRALQKELPLRYKSAVEMRAELASALTLHEKAVRVASRFEGVPVDQLPTMIYESADQRIDPLASTEDQMARTLMMHESLLEVPDSVTPRMDPTPRTTEPAPPPSDLAPPPPAAAPPEFAARVVAVSAAARAAPPRVQVSRMTWLALAAVVVLGVAGILLALVL